MKTRNVKHVKYEDSMINGIQDNQRNTDISKTINTLFFEGGDKNIVRINLN